jgi:UDP-glucose 4-epimerase
MMQSSTPHSRAIILGAGGFIGINLANALALEGYEVICFNRSLCLHRPQNAKFITGDFESMPSDLLAIFDNAVVYHLISSCRPSQSTENAADELIADVATTLRYLEYTRTRNIRWVFVSSGGTVYGPDVSCPTTENDYTNPICPYGLVKLTLEKYLSLYKKIHGTDFVVARVSNPYGPWQNPLRDQGIIATVIYKALNHQPIDIWGDGKNVRDYLFIDDAVRGLLEIARYGKSGSTYNLSSGEGTTINELITILDHSLGLHPKTNYVSARITDVRRSILDSTKLQNLSGWRSKTPLEAGFKKTADWIYEYYLKKQQIIS